MDTRAQTDLPETLPPDWATVQFGELCGPVRDAAVPSANGNRLYLGLEHLASGQPSLVGRGNESEVSSGKTEFRKGDVLFGKLRPYLRKSAIAPEDGMCSTDILVFRPTAKSCAEYLCYITHTDDFVEYAKATTSGVQHPRTSWAALREFELSIPPIAEQRKIAAVLGLVQRATEEQERLIALTTELKKVVVYHLFTHGVRGEPQRETEIGAIPETWKLVPCARLCKEITVGVVVKPASYYVERGIPAFRSLNIREDKLETGDLVYFSSLDNDTKLKKSKLETGDVLVVRTGYPGTSCVVPAEFDGANCIDIVILRPKHELIGSGFLSRFFNSPAGRRQALASKHGLAQQHLNVGAVKRTLIPVPSCDEQQTIDNALASVQQKLSVHERKRGALNALFRTLLYQLVSAQISVNDLDLRELESAVAG